MKARLTTLLVVGVLALLYADTALAQQPKLVVQTGHSDEVNSVAFSVDGKILASGSNDNTIRLWEVATGRQLGTLAHSMSVRSVAFSRDGRTLASGAGGTIKLWEVATGRELRTFSGHSSYITSVAFSVDGRTLASGSDDTTIKLWDVASGRESRTLADPSTKVTSVAFSPDGKTLASGNVEWKVILREVATGRELRTLAGHSDEVSSVVFSADGRTLASGSEDKTLKLWEVATGRALRTFTGHFNGISSVAFSADGKTLVSGSGKLTVGGTEDNTIKLWDVATGRELRTFTGHSSRVTSVALSGDGKTLASGSDDMTIRLWDVSAGRMLHALGGHSNVIHSVALSGDGKTLATGGADTKVRLWDLTTGGGLRTLAGHSKGVNSVAFSVDSKTLVSHSMDDNTTKIWEVATGRELRTPAQAEGGLQGVLSADGKTLANSEDNTIKLWDVTTGRELREFIGHESSIHSIEFSPDGKTLVSGSRDNTIKLWDVATGRELRAFTGHSDWITQVAFRADGKTLVSASGDSTIKLWDVATGRELRTLTAHSEEVTSIAFSTDGEFLVSGSWDATTKLWRLDTGELLASLISFDKGGWAVVTPDGRFDADSLEEIPNLHWVFPGDPFKPLPPEIFMRQYYEPRLLSRLLQEKSFDPVPPLASLNRVQPEVKIRSVVPATDAKGFVKLTVDVANASGEQTRDGAKVTLSSEVHDLRLFRDGQLVGYVPGKIPLDSAGKATLERVVKLSRYGSQSEVEFTAYAFNSDQVKSATASLTYQPGQALPAVKGRAYVISVGVNAYEDTNWRLSFAARDARVSDEMLTRKLTASGEYEVVPVKLISDYQQSSANVLSEKLATKENFHTVLKLLAEGPARIAPEVLKEIPGAEKLRLAEPEDLVLINFSSHGYTDRQGKFYLIPYDTGAEIKFSADGQDIAAESLARFISSDELSEWVRGIDAGELVMIVDTCHAASAVEQPGFKPGPMGSRGMGQLAYDKGMRILAASQADDVALELDRLQHGLLTYALMEEGLNQKQADKNSDGKITLDEWLRYGVARVPELYEDLKRGRLAELKSRDVRITSLLSGPSVKKNAFQQPQLFDFKRKGREVVLQ